MTKKVVDCLPLFLYSSAYSCSFRLHPNPVLRTPEQRNPAHTRRLADYTRRPHNPTAGSTPAALREYPSSRGRSSSGFLLSAMNTGIGSFGRSPRTGGTSSGVTSHASTNLRSALFTAHRRPAVLGRKNTRLTRGLRLRSTHRSCGACIDEAGVALRSHASRHWSEPE